MSFFMSYLLEITTYKFIMIKFVVKKKCFPVIVVTLNYAKSSISSKAAKNTESICCPLLAAIDAAQYSLPLNCTS